jgi:hypothetical protein
MIILGGIRKLYPKSIVRNDMILFNTDWNKIKVMKKKNVISSSIWFSPNIPDIDQYVDKEFIAPKIDMNIYSYYKSEFLPGQIFYANYEVTNEDVMKKNKRY